MCVVIMMWVEMVKCEKMVDGDCDVSEGEVEVASFENVLVLALGGHVDSDMQ